MGWQDRDYASPGRRDVSAWGPAPTGILRGRSIVTSLIVINVAVYVLQSLDPFNVIFGLGAMQAAAVMRGDVWRLVTAQYLHGSALHLFVNMLGLHFLGRPLERIWSARRFLVIYTLCGVAGNVFFTVLASRDIINPYTPAVGASGSIYGLLGIAAVLFPTATVYVYFVAPFRIRTAVLVFAGLSVLMILLRGHNYGGEACHLAGLVFGAWWAKWGEVWWDRSEWRIPGLNTQRRRAGRGAFAAKMEQRRQDEMTIDHILKKVSDDGIASLTEKEKRELQEASERQRAREAGLGRVDRL